MVLTMSASRRRRERCLYSSGGVAKVKGGVTSIRIEMNLAWANPGFTPWKYGNPVPSGVRIPCGYNSRPFRSMNYASSWNVDDGT